ncbi:hypothetical protein HAX54_019814, partial [Datura stramonium]|nr:hypothetical protein [Datura stramonium]
PVLVGSRSLIGDLDSVDVHTLSRSINDAIIMGSKISSYNRITSALVTRCLHPGATGRATWQQHCQIGRRDITYLQCDAA